MFIWIFLKISMKFSKWASCFHFILCGKGGARIYVLVCYLCFFVHNFCSAPSEHSLMSFNCCFPSFHLHEGYFLPTSQLYYLTLFHLLFLEFWYLLVAFQEVYFVIQWLIDLLELVHFARMLVTLYHNIVLGHIFFY